MSPGLKIEWGKNTDSLFNNRWVRWIVMNSKLSPHRKGSKMGFRSRTFKRVVRGSILNHNMNSLWTPKDQICRKRLSHHFKARGRFSSGRPSLLKKVSYSFISQAPTLSNGSFQPTTTQIQTKRKLASLKTGSKSRTTLKKYITKISYLANPKKQNLTQKHIFYKQPCLAILPSLNFIYR